MHHQQAARLWDPDRLWWLVIALLAVGATSAYVIVSHSAVPPPSLSLGAESSEVAVDDDVRGASVEPVSLPVHRVAQSASAPTLPEQQRAMVAKALADAVRQARINPSATPTPTNHVVVDAKDQMPLVEMSWEQYRAWTKYANALAGRDYNATLELLSNVRQLFDPAVGGAMEDAFVQDYQAFLDDVVEARCDGTEPESVWRKTMFMQFVLVKLNRSSEALQQKATEARQLCGYAG